LPTKRELVAKIEKRMQQVMRTQRTSYQRGAVTDDSVALLLFSMNYTWENRFLLRDHAQFTNDPNALRLGPDRAADLEVLHELLRRMNEQGMFRRDLRVDLRVLARSFWIVSRFWMDPLREFEGLEQLTWVDRNSTARSAGIPFKADWRESTRRGGACPWRGPSPCGPPCSP
jgi:hypothetical protein